MTVVAEGTAQDEFLELLAGTREPAHRLLHLDGRHTVLLQLGDEVLRVPRIDAELDNGILRHEFVDPLRDGRPTDDVAGRGMQIALPGPDVVRHAVALR